MSVRVSLNRTDDLSSHMARPCFREPWLLDTQEKVAWANDIAPECRGWMVRTWKLGDHCWYRPA